MKISLKKSYEMGNVTTDYPSFSLVGSVGQAPSPNGLEEECRGKGQPAVRKLGQRGTAQSGKRRTHQLLCTAIERPRRAKGTS